MSIAAAVARVSELEQMLRFQSPGKSVSAAIEVPPAAANAPNQRNDSVIKIQRKKANFRFSRIKP